MIDDKLNHMNYRVLELMQAMVGSVTDNWIGVHIKRIDDASDNNERALYLITFVLQNDKKDREEIQDVIDSLEVYNPSLNYEYVVTCDSSVLRNHMPFSRIVFKRKMQNG